jgi:hypothetical protein
MSGRSILFVRVHELRQRAAPTSRHRSESTHVDWKQQSPLGEPRQSAEARQVPAQVRVGLPASAEAHAIATAGGR